MNRRFLYAMLVYAVLAILAAFTLEGLIRIATLVLLGGFAFENILSRTERPHRLSVRHILLRIILGLI